MSKDLTRNDIKRIRNAMHSVGTPTFFKHYKRLFGAKLQFDTFLMMRFGPDAPPILLDTWLQPNVLSASALTEYSNRTYLLDPFFQFRGFPKTGAIYQVSDIAPDRFFSSEYYLDYYRETGLCDEVGLLASLPNGEVAHLSLSRLKTSGAYRRRDIQCLQHHAPILLELLTQHSVIMLRQEGANPSKTQFSPLSDIIRAQSLDLFRVQLTARETQIAALILLGHSNGSSSLKLGISRETTKVHRRNLYRKLSISSQGELFALFTHLL